MPINVQNIQWQEMKTLERQANSVIACKNEKRTHSSRFNAFVDSVQNMNQSVSSCRHQHQMPVKYQQMSIMVFNTCHHNRTIIIALIITNY